MRAAIAVSVALVVLASTGGYGPLAQEAFKPDPQPAKPTKVDTDSDRAHLTAALQWLADHQHKDGYWSAKDYSAASTRAKAKKTHNSQWVLPGKPNGDTGSLENDHVAMSGLALLAFAEGGYDHKENSPFKKTVLNAVTWLKQKQGNTGAFGDESKCSMVHDHAAATSGLASTYGLSGDALLKPLVDSAIKWLLLAQNPGLGWRYGVKTGKNDTRMTGWCVAALKDARVSGIEFESDQPYSGADMWLELITVDVNAVPRTGYVEPGAPMPREDAAKAWATHPEMDAINVFCRLAMAKSDLKDTTLKKQVELMLDHIPTWDEHKADFAYWYWATRAFFLLGGKDRSTWNDKVVDVLMKNQRGWRPEDKDSTAETLDEYGSWDAIDPEWKTGGRVWSTAMAALAFNEATGYRYQREGKD